MVEYNKEFKDYIQKNPCGGLRVYRFYCDWVICITRYTITCGYVNVSMWKTDDYKIIEYKSYYNISKNETIINKLSVNDILKNKR